MAEEIKVVKTADARQEFPEGQITAGQLEDFLASAGVPRHATVWIDRYGQNNNTILRAVWEL